LEAFHHIVVSSGDAIGAVNAGFDTVNLHHPARRGEGPKHRCATAIMQAPNTTIVESRNLKLKAKFETASSYHSFKHLTSSAVKPGNLGST
jgi:hypothetical protein